MINDNLKDKIETELKRATLSLYEDNRDLEIPNIDKLNQKAKVAIQNQMSELNEIFTLKNQAVAIENNLVERFKSDSATPKQPQMMTFSSDILDAITHGRIEEHYNKELDYTSRSYILLNSRRDESGYSRSVVKSLLKDQVLDAESNEYIGSRQLSNPVIQTIAKDIGDPDGVYSQVKAKVIYEQTGPDIEGIKNVPFVVNGLLYKDKKGDDMFAFFDEQQDYYDSRNNGVKKISVADARIEQIFLADATYRSTKLDSIENKIERKIMDFEDSMKNNLQPIYNEKSIELEKVNFNRKSILKNKDSADLARTRMEKDRVYSENVNLIGENMLENEGIRFKDAKVGAFFTDRKDIEYSFLVEVGNAKRKTVYEIAIPTDAIVPFSYDSKNPPNGVSEELHIRVENKGSNPQAGVPLVFNSNGKQEDYLSDNSNKHIILKNAVAAFEEISLSNTEQLKDEYAEPKRAGNQQPLSVEVNKVGVIDELNKALRLNFKNIPEFKQALTDEKKKGNGLSLASGF